MKILVSILFLLLSCTLHAQKLRLHVGGGLSNYLGDMQKSITLNQAHGVYSGGLNYQVTDKVTVRADYSFANVSASDAKSNHSRIISRNLSFYTHIREFAIMGEYELLRMKDEQASLYVAGGLGVFNYDPYTYDRLGNKIFLAPLSTEGQGFPEYPDRKVYKLTQVNIPIGGGVKYNITPYITTGVEIVFRKLFTDYLDDLSQSYIDRDILLNRSGPTAVALAFRENELPPHNRNYPSAGAIRGGSALDWYYFVQARLIFSLDWIKGSGGYSGARSFKNSRKRFGCPTRF